MILSGWFPGYEKELGFSDEEIYQNMLKHINMTKNKDLKKEFLFQAGNMYCEYEDRADIEKAKFFYEWIIKEFPNDEELEYLGIQARLNNVKVVVGAQAEDFNVTSFDGQKVKLSDYKNQYVLLVFWKPWSSSGDELQDVMKLYNATERNKLEIIGFAYNFEKGDINQARSYAEDQHLPFLNSIVNDKIKEAYGVSEKTITFLIAPGGKIIGKGIEGNRIIEKVRLAMEKFERGEI